MNLAYLNKDFQKILYSVCINCLLSRESLIRVQICSWHILLQSKLKMLKIQWLKLQF